MSDEPDRAPVQLSIDRALLAEIDRLGTLWDLYRYEVLEEVAEGRHTAEQRILLEARIQRDGKEVACYDAVNDIVLHKTSLARIVDFEISLDGNFASSIRADGLILSTPTGSTAYSLSAGGPVVLPNVDAIIITPIAPHMLTTRPLVLPSSSKIEAKFKYREEPIYLTADGQVGEELRPGDTITVAKSPRSMNLIRSPKRDFFEILRSKLGWGAQ